MVPSDLFQPLVLVGFIWINIEVTLLDRLDLYVVLDWWSLGVQSERKMRAFGAQLETPLDCNPAVPPSESISNLNG